MNLEHFYLLARSHISEFRAWEGDEHQIRFSETEIYEEFAEAELGKLWRFNRVFEAEAVLGEWRMWEITDELDERLRNDPKYERYFEDDRSVDFDAARALRDGS